MDEFFVGYLPVPPGIRALIRRTIAALIGFVCLFSLTLLLAQAPFVNSRFDFQQFREYQGFLTARPYPILSPGWLLVAPGKHGAAGLPTGYVNVQGERIQNGEDRGLEIQGVAQASRPASSPPLADQDLGPIEWKGEIVDSKCYYGVMNPGRGKVHRDCAARCIAGGIPPAILVRDAHGTARTVLLAGADRRALNAELGEYIAEPVIVRGRLIRTNGRLMVLAEDLRSLPE